jgi:iron complex outermembrane receptor protein
MTFCIRYLGFGQPLLDTRATRSSCLCKKYFTKVCPHFASKRSSTPRSQVFTATLTSLFRGGGCFMRLSVVATCLSLCLTWFAFAADAKASIRKDLAIPAQELSPALQDLAKQYDFQVLYKTELVTNVHTGGAVGTLTSDEALGKVLSGTGLTYKYLDDKTVTIISTSTAGSAQSTTQNAWSGSSDDASTPKEAGKKSSQDFRIAQVDQGAAGPSAVDKNDQNSEKKKKKDELTEIVVTGTNISGVAPVGSPLITISRADIENSGYTTVEQVMGALPQNFQGGASGASSDGYNFATGANAGFNTTAGVGVNLRGLGTSATLILINGRRTTSSNVGFFTDVSTIPLEAIERIEVLPDGASAIYGADAVAGVVNFILRKDYHGADTRLGYDFTSGGGRGQYQIGQTVGANWSGGNVLLDAQYLKQDPLWAYQREITNSVSSPTNVYPENVQKNLLLSLQHAFNDVLSVQSDAQYAKFDRGNVWSNSANTFLYPTQNDRYNVGATLRYTPTDRWELSLDAGTSRETDDQSAITLDKSSGQLAIPPSYLRANSREWDATLKADGTIFKLPGGDVKVAAGGTRRNERASFEQSPPPFTFFSTDRNITSAFLELYVPLIGSANAMPGVQGLQLSLAERYDHYSDFGGTTNPRFGLSWTIIPSVNVRGSYSKSFRAPATGYEFGISLLGTSYVAVLPVTGPTGTGTIPAVQLGGSHALDPEKSRNWTLGLTYTPEFVAGLKLDVTYYDIAYTNQIVQPPFDAGVLSNPALQPFVARYSSPALLQAAIASYLAAGAPLYDLTGGEFGPNPLSGTQYLYDARQTNAASTAIRGADFGVEYSRAIGVNDFRSALSATYIRSIDTQYSPTAPSIDLVSTFSNPVDWKFRGTVGWTRGPLTSAAAVNFVNAYTNDRNSVAPQPIGSFVTADVSFRYVVNGASNALKNIRLSLSVSNILNRQPPFAPGVGVTPINFDAANANPLGRTFALEMSKKW